MPYKKSAGKAKETHYNKPEKGPRKEGSDRPKRSSGGSDRPYSGRTAGTGSSEGKPYRKREEGGSSERPAYRKSNNNEGGGERPFRPRRDDAAKPYGKRDNGTDKPYGKREERNGERPQRKAFGDKPFNRDGENPQRKSYGDKPSYNDGKRPFGRDDAKGGERRATGGKPPFKKPEEAGDRWEGRSYGDKPFQKKREGTGDRPQRRDSGEKPFKGREEGDRPERKAYGDKPAYVKREGSEGDSDRKPFRKPFSKQKDVRPKREGAGEKPRETFHSESPTGRKRIVRPSEGDERRERAARSYNKRTKFDRDDIWEGEEEEATKGKWDEEAKAGPMTLNKYLAHAGVSSRRDAAVMIKEGKVTVNGKVLAEPGYRVQEGDVITLDGKTMTPQRHHVYILLNKPKDFITTTEDDKGRRTVMDLVANAGIEKLYPVGRLDRQTTGVLLLTNDGDLAQKLSHPSYETKKIYQVTLDKAVTKADFDKIVEGVDLEDGKADVDRLSYLEKKNEIGIEIHSGRNRIVRRIFEHLGYNVIKLDRVLYAGLTKKNVSRGKWRFLNDKEITFLKHFKTR